MAELKTKPAKVSVERFLKNISDEQQRADSRVILKTMKEITGLKPTMWGPSMIGFGDYHYKYESGHEGDCFLMGFSPRKGSLTLYIMPGVGTFASHLTRLGKHKTGKSCLYIKKLADIDQEVLREMIEISYAKRSKPAQQNKRAEPAKKSRSRK